MKESLSILSLNVNGLRDDLKRSNLFLWLKLFPTDIILLQDTHYSPADSDLWTRQWGLPVVWSEFNAALSTNRSLSLSKVPTPDLSPRITIFSVQLASQQDPHYFGSVYVPAQYAARGHFLANLPPDLHLSLSFLAGDCNMIPNPSLDRIPPSNDPPHHHWTSFSSTLQQWELVDIHRHLCDDGNQVTRWAQLHSGRIGRRIDNLFVNSAQITLFSDTSTMLCPYSDHLALLGNMKIASAAQHGSGSWKLNSSLLHNPTFQDGSSRIWTDLTSNPLPSPQSTWEEAKSLFQAFSIHFASQSKHHRSSLISSLQNQLQDLDRRIATGLVDPELLHIERVQVSAQLHQALSDTFEGLRVRSRARWIEAGEKSSAYFHRLIAARRLSSSITKVLASDGSLVSSIEDVIAEARGFYEQLYASSPTSTADQDTLLSCITSRLTQDQASALDNPISPVEVANAIKMAPFFFFFFYSKTKTVKVFSEK